MSRNLTTLIGICSNLNKVAYKLAQVYGHIQHNRRTLSVMKVYGLYGSLFCCRTLPYSMNNSLYSVTYCISRKKALFFDIGDVRPLKFNAISKRGCVHPPAKPSSWWTKTFPTRLISKQYRGNFGWPSHLGQLEHLWSGLCSLACYCHAHDDCMRESGTQSDADNSSLFSITTLPPFRTGHTI